MSYRWLRLEMPGPSGQGHALVLGADEETLIFVLGLNMSEGNPITIINQRTGERREIAVRDEHKRYQFGWSVVGTKMIIVGGMRFGAGQVPFREVLALDLKTYQLEEVATINAPDMGAATMVMQKFEDDWERRRRARFLIYGGDNDGQLDPGMYFLLVEEIDGRLRCTFQRITPTIKGGGELPRNRFYHTMLIENGVAWIYGGCLGFEYHELHDYSDEVLTFNTRTLEFTRHTTQVDVRTTAPPAKRPAPKTTSLLTSLARKIGLLSDSKSASNNNNDNNDNNGDEDDMMQGPGKRSNHVAWLDGPYMYIFGGYRPTAERNDLWKLHRETMVWSRGHACGPPFPPVWGHVSCAIGEAAALIHGGETAWDAGRAARNDVYMLLGFEGYSAQTHKFFPHNLRDAVKTLWLLAQIDPVTRLPRHPQAMLFVLPFELLLEIARHLMFISN